MYFSLTPVLTLFDNSCFNCPLKAPTSALDNPRASSCFAFLPLPRPPQLLACSNSSLSYSTPSSSAAFFIQSSSLPPFSLASWVSAIFLASVTRSFSRLTRRRSMSIVRMK